MKKMILFIFLVGIILCMTLGRWWVLETKENKQDPLNKNSLFVYQQNDNEMIWYELRSSNGNITGYYNEHQLVEKVGREPYMKEVEYKITGKRNDGSYDLKINKKGKTIKIRATIIKNQLVVRKENNKKTSSYKIVTTTVFNQKMKKLHKKLDNAVYHAEEKEKNRLRTFFSNLKEPYMYRAQTSDGKATLYLKIKQALLQGEVEATLIAVTDGQKEVFQVGGIADGVTFRLYVDEKGKTFKLKGAFPGTFQGDVTPFTLSYWKTKEMVTFKSITEETYKKEMKNN